MQNQSDLSALVTSPVEITKAVFESRHELVNTHYPEDSKRPYGSCLCRCERFLGAGEYITWYVEVDNRYFRFEDREDLPVDEVFEKARLHIK